MLASCGPVSASARKWGACRPPHCGASTLSTRVRDPRHRFDSQQRGLRPRCHHWSTCRRYKLASVVAFQPVLLPLLRSLLLRQHVALLHWTVERRQAHHFTAAWTQVALPWRQRGQQSRLTRANPEISILPGSSLRHTKSQSLPLVSCRDATCSHCLHLTWLALRHTRLESLHAEHVRWLILRVCDPKNQLKMRHGLCRPEKFSPVALRKMRLAQHIEALKHLWVPTHPSAKFSCGALALFTSACRSANVYGSPTRRRGRRLASRTSSRLDRPATAAARGSPHHHQSAIVHVPHPRAPRDSRPRRHTYATPHSGVQLHLSLIYAPLPRWLPSSRGTPRATTPSSRSRISSRT